MTVLAQELAVHADMRAHLYNRTSRKVARTEGEQREGESIPW